MPARVCVHLLPGLTTPEELAGGTVVVVDILRATTTIVHALAAGAWRILPVLDVADAEKLRFILNSPDVVLGGERGGKKIAGFELGNSPAEYTTASVGGKTLIFTTTNGTRAMQMCRGATRVLLGSFANFSSVCREVANVERLDILCAGTDGQITREDVLFAGAVVDDLQRTAGISTNDEADIAGDAWRAAVSDFAGPKPLAEYLRASTGGRNLIEIGHERDIDIAAQIDRFDLLAELDLKDWAIHSGHWDRRPA
jgi:2-phosphosulfolactate phosphatase